MTDGKWNECRATYRSIHSTESGAISHEEPVPPVQLQPFPFLSCTLAGHVRTPTLFKCRVIRNDCRGFNNLSYTIQSRQEYVFAPMDLEVYVPPLPASISELKVRIRTVTETITADIRNELDYRDYVCRITQGAHNV